MSFLLVLIATEGVYLRMLQHLLPNGLAWRTTVAKKLRSFFVGLSATLQNARDFIDLVFADLFPDTTRELAEWEAQFALDTQVDDADRRSALAGAWQAQGGQSPRYLQDTMQAAGFDVYIHEFWSGANVAPRTVRDPRTYTDLPLIGQTQCGDDGAECGEADAFCSRFLVNNPGYLVNNTLTGEAPPPVPDDPNTWPYFLYWGGPVFPNPAVIPATRRAEFEKLLLKICPAHLWLVTLITYDVWLVGSGPHVGDPGLFVGLEAP